MDFGSGKGECFVPKGGEVLGKKISRKEPHEKGYKTDGEVRPGQRYIPVKLCDCVISSEPTKT